MRTALNIVEDMRDRLASNIKSGAYAGGVIKEEDIALHRELELLLESDRFKAMCGTIVFMKEERKVMAVPPPNSKDHLTEFRRVWFELWDAESGGETCVAQTNILMWMVNHRRFMDAMIDTFEEHWREHADS